MLKFQVLASFALILVFALVLGTYFDYVKFELFRGFKSHVTRAMIGGLIGWAFAGILPMPSYLRFVATIGLAGLSTLYFMAVNWMVSKDTSSFVRQLNEYPDWIWRGSSASEPSLEPSSAA